MKSGADLTGQTFGRWRVLREVPHEPRAKRRWLCRCTCGIEAEVRIDHLRSGTSASCGRRHLEGQRIGALEVLYPAPNVRSRSRYHVKGLTAWVARCSCGREVLMTTEELLRPTTTDCGHSRLKPAAPVSRSVPSTGWHEPAPDVPLKTTSSAEVLRQFHRDHAPLGEVRRVCRPADEDEEAGGVLSDFNPFEFNPD
jgi:hypothetical protein